MLWTCIWSPALSAPLSCHLRPSTHTGEACALALLIIIPVLKAGRRFIQCLHTWQALEVPWAPSRCAANVCMNRQLYQVFLCFHKTLMHGFSQFYGHRTMRHLFLLIFKSCKWGKYCLFLCVGQ